MMKLTVVKEYMMSEGMEEETPEHEPTTLDDEAWDGEGLHYEAWDGEGLHDEAGEGEGLHDEAGEGEGESSDMSWTTKLEQLKQLKPLLLAQHGNMKSGQKCSGPAIKSGNLVPQIAPTRLRMPRRPLATPVRFG